MISNKHDHRADDRDKHAVYIETGHSGLAEKPKQSAADHRSDHPEADVEEETFSFPIHDLAGDEAGEQPKDDPADD
jgi:hypothetical protein